MAGLVPAVHVEPFVAASGFCTGGGAWMAETSPAMTVKRKLREVFMLARLVAVFLAAATAASAEPIKPADFVKLTEDWYQDQFQAHPLVASFAGFHQWDGKIDDVTETGHKAEQASLHTWLDRFEKLDPSTLPLGQKDDREVLIGQIKSQLLEEETIQAWRHDPGKYPSLVTEAVFQTVKRDYAPLDERMGYAIARTESIPAVLATAKTLIRDPAQVLVTVALQNLDGSLEFFKTGLPEAFKSVQGAARQQQLANANKAAITALEDYRTWLKALEPNAKGSFALGPETYRRKLAYDEMVDMPLDQLLAVGEAQLKKDQAALVATAKAIDPAKTVEQVAADLLKDHPAAEALVPTAENQLAALRKFIVDHNLTPLPPENHPTVAATPMFERAVVEAEMDPPGPYEKHANEAFYFLTPPAADLDAKQREEYLQGFNIPVLNNVSVHEVFPGHFVQLMLMRSLPDLSMVRRLAGVNSNVEGWAHYCEQMTLDEGFGGGDPKLRFGQLIDALLRDGRYVAAIKLHTQGMTIEQAADMFVHEAHQTAPIALMEARRGASDATYLYYALGKLQILKLRQDWQKKMGDRYTIGDFHRRLLESGTVPIKVIRREMMGTDGPLL
jgi:uncharacterized protein (DUF885 family)